MILGFLVFLGVVGGLAAALLLPPSSRPSIEEAITILNTDLGGPMDPAIKQTLRQTKAIQDSLITEEGVPGKDPFDTVYTWPYDDAPGRDDHRGYTRELGIAAKHQIEASNWVELVERLTQTEGAFYRLELAPLEVNSKVFFETRGIVRQCIYALQGLAHTSLEIDDDEAALHYVHLTIALRERDTQHGGILHRLESTRVIPITEVAARLMQRGRLSADQEQSLAEAFDTSHVGPTGSSAIKHERYLRSLQHRNAGSRFPERIADWAEKYEVFFQASEEQGFYSDSDLIEAPWSRRHSEKPKHLLDALTKASLANAHLDVFSDFVHHHANLYHRRALVPAV